MLKGMVIKGEGKAQKHGYPTANLDVPPSKIHLRDGVYAAWVILNKKKYSGALVILADKQKVEVHILDYDGENLYGLYLEVDPVQKISEIEQLDPLALNKKIANDIALIKDFMATLKI